jgi:hypothetical protein
MEVILNAAWLIIAVASYGFLASHLANRGPEYVRGIGRFRSIIALGCALALLFPVISLSDDLQEMQAAVAEVPTSRGLIKKFRVYDPSNPQNQPHHVSFIIPSFITGIVWVSLRGVAPQQTTNSVPCLNLTTPCRAPPSSGVPKIS